ncbi:MAG: ImmA/IrrE family metallo-endopeptidase [bacterium]
MNLPHILEPLRGRLAFKSLWYIYEVIESYGIEIKEMPFPSGQEGLFYQDDENKIIFISNLLSLYEKRVAAVHELVHALLHERTGALCLSNTLWEDKVEYEAKLYTSRLLIPKDKLIELLDMEYSIYDIAEEFQVTESLVKIAIEDVERNIEN